MKAKLSAFFVLLLALFLLAQGIDECDRMTSIQKDGCYLSRAKGAEECAYIGDPKVRDECYLAIAEARATSYTECDRLFSQYQPVCYARITYQGKKNQMACEELQAEFKEECYVYFAAHSSAGGIESCESIPPNYKERCLEAFFAKTGPKSEADCRSFFSEKYLAPCIGYVDSRENAAQKFVGLLGSSWSFLTAPWTIAGIAIFVVLLIFFIMMRVWMRAAKKS